MIFRTELSAKPNNPQLTYKDNLLFLGSCFADNMSTYFKQARFNCTSNPFGTLYHPVAISKAIRIALDDDYRTDPIETNELWTSFDVHSSLSRAEKEEFLQNFNIKQQELKEQLLDAQFLFITLGTAHVYKHKSSNTIVANCHKISQSEFRKELLSFELITSSLEKTIKTLLQVNPKINIVFTLSPVRYLRDGFEGNQLSKSLLYVAIKDVVASHDKVSYFPSYEFILDDLRDYRYYEKDLVHPNQLALDYVWEKLKLTFLSEKTQQILRRIEKINARLNHRLFNPETPAAKAFVKDTHALIDVLQCDFPDLDFGF